MLRKASQFQPPPKRKRGDQREEPYFLDPWRHAVCDRCPLPDCVRPEGAIFATNSKNGSCYKVIRDCPIYQAEQRGWGPDEAAERGAELGLLEKVEWLEW
jgi:hypothetical protein